MGMTDTPDPVEVPGFAIVRRKVATGLKPDPNAIPWFKNHGYKAVLHLRTPGQDDTVAKRLFERNNLRYFSIEVSPTRLTKEIYDEFVRIVDDTANHPLYVYDRDGSMAGSLWYLYHRVALGRSNETAVAEAQRLGLLLDDPEHKKMYLAAQTLLRTLRP